MNPNKINYATFLEKVKSPSLKRVAEIMAVSMIALANSGCTKNEIEGTIGGIMLIGATLAGAIFSMRRFSKP